jgi:hypothetical protein
MHFVGILFTMSNDCKEPIKIVGEKKLVSTNKHKKEELRFEHNEYNCNVE